MKNTCCTSELQPLPPQNIGTLPEFQESFFFLSLTSESGWTTYLVLKASYYLYSLPNSQFRGILTFWFSKGGR